MKKGNTIFVTGIGTEVGKTVVSAILTRALDAEYFKPVQAGDLNYSDTHKVIDWAELNPAKKHKNIHALNVPASPHAAARADNIRIEKTDFEIPTSENNIVIEGAGGLLVPLNDDGLMIADLLTPDMIPVVVSRHYLGSINHTMLTLNELKNRGFDKFVLVFNGAPNIETESIILKMHPPLLTLHLNELAEINKETIAEVAQEWKKEWIKTI